jgi:hypothetical protein
MMTMITPASGRCHGLAKKVSMCHRVEAQDQEKVGKEGLLFPFFSNNIAMSLIIEHSLQMEFGTSKR